MTSALALVDVQAVAPTSTHACRMRPARAHTLFPKSAMGGTWMTAPSPTRADWRQGQTGACAATDW